MAIRFKKRPGLVAYITCGDPDLDTSREVVLAAIRAGADVIELGVPFSDPVADGPVIQRASERALKHGTTLEGVLGVAKQIREKTKAGVIIFSYLNPILQFGLDRFCAAAVAAGVDGALVTDLPVEEAGDYLRAMKAHKLAPVFLAAPTSTDERLRAIAKCSRGFVYAISRTGITGARQELAGDARSLVERLRVDTRIADCGGIWSVYAGAVCGGWEFCGCGGGGQRDCAVHRTESWAGSSDGGGLGGSVDGNGADVANECRRLKRLLKKPESRSLVGLKASS